MDRILKILKKENGPRASSAPALELNTIIFKHVYWYMQQISGERLQDHWSSGLVHNSFITDIIVLNQGKKKNGCKKYLHYQNLLKVMFWICGSIMCGTITSSLH